MNTMAETVQNTPPEQASPPKKDEAGTHETHDADARGKERVARETREAEAVKKDASLPNMRRIENADNIGYQAKNRADAEWSLIAGSAAGVKKEVLERSYIDAYTKEKSAMVDFRDMSRTKRIEHLCDVRAKYKGEPTKQQVEDEAISLDIWMAYNKAVDIRENETDTNADGEKDDAISDDIDKVLARKYQKSAPEPAPKKEIPPAAVASSPATAPFTLSSFLKDIGGFWGAVGVAALTFFGLSKSDNGKTNLQNILASFTKGSDSNKG